MNNNAFKIAVVFIIELFCLNKAIGQPSCIIQEFMDGSIIKWVYSGGDEFDGDCLDTVRWYTCENGWRREHGFDELQYYLDENIVIENGILKLVSKNEPGEYPVLSKDEEGNEYLILRHFDYTSGWIQTKQKYKHGLFEIRCKLPEGKGLWPAFWLFGGHPNEEIDVFEYLGEAPNKIHCSVHYPENNLQHNVITANGYFSDDFNVIRGQWDENLILWFLNDVPNPISVWLGSLNVKESVIANMAVASEGCFGSTGPDSTTLFPSSFEIDYIRIWTRFACEQNKIIENYHQTITDPTVVTGQTILVKGNGNLFNNQFLTLIASEEITIKPGFHAVSGSSFSAKIVECPEVPDIKDRMKEETPCVLDVNETMRSSYENEITNSKDNVLYGEKEVDNTVLTIKIFPNPSHDEINIELQGCFNRYIDFSLYNSFGKNIYSNKANNATLINIDVSSLPKGVYILLCQIEHNIITEKIVIE